MNITLTPRSILGLIGAASLMFFAGYGVGNIGAKAFNFLTADAAVGTILF